MSFHAAPLLEPQLPPQLEQGYDERAREVFDYWSNQSTDQVVAAFTEAKTYIDPSDANRSIRYGVIDPRGGEPNPDHTMMMSLTIGKSWTPETFLMASVVHDLVLADGRLVVFPNNSLSNKSYTLSKAERHHIGTTGDFSPLADRQYAVAQALGITSVEQVLGRSQGAAVGAAFASRAHDHGIELHSVHLDEAPNSYPGGARGALGLRKSVTREASQIRPSIHSAGLSSYDEIGHVDDAVAYNLGMLRFLIGGNLLKSNLAVNKAFLQPGFFRDLEAMLESSPLVTLSLSNASGSTVGNAANAKAFAEVANGSARGEVAKHSEYDGYHVTAVSPFVLGLLGVQALEWDTKVTQHAQASSDATAPAAQPKQPIG